jgi:hypothetical protein
MPTVVANIPSRASLRSAGQSNLPVSMKLKLGELAFSVSGPKVSNFCQVNLKLAPVLSISNENLKLFFYQAYGNIKASIILSNCDTAPLFVNL